MVRPASKSRARRPWRAKALTPLPCQICSPLSPTTGWWRRASITGTSVSGPGRNEIPWGFGTAHVNLESAPSGHWCIPVDDFRKRQPRSAGLPPEQLTLLAVGNDGQEDDAID
eukprot:8085818-Pyramimonas_sp.AAC.1